MKDLLKTVVACPAGLDDLFKSPNNAFRHLYFRCARNRRNNPRNISERN